MKFNDFKSRLQDNFYSMVRDAQHLFTVDLDKDELWDLYLDSFPKGTNPKFRERREHDCSCCRHFIKSIGNVVSIKDNRIKSIWDFDAGSETFNTVAKALSEFVHTKTVDNIYVSKFNTVGVDFNYEYNDEEIIKWEHFYLELPDQFVEQYKSIADVQGSCRDVKNVFKRSLEEITEESLTDVLELIEDNNLYRGEEWKSSLEKFLSYKKAYMKIEDEEEKNNFAWEKSIEAGAVVGKIRNHSMGVLLLNLSEGIDIEIAVKKYESIFENYKRPKPIFTKKMREEARKTAEKLGYMDSLQRRFATLDDITINNILFANRDSAKRMQGLNIFDQMEQEDVINPKKFANVHEISINEFINDILPNSTEISALFENKHNNNLVSLIAPQIKDSKPMFNWNNGFSWAYTGNITDSSMKQRVKAAGGKVDGVLRFSIQWNDDNEFDCNDLDAHCIEPHGYHIYWRNAEDYFTNGELDVDIRVPRKDKVAVENITWSNIDKMQKGEYLFYVHCFDNREGRSGFRAEIEFNGQIYSFDYNRPLGHNEVVKVASVIFDGNEFKIKQLLPSNISSRQVWGLNTNQFIPVSVIMYSPNYWDEQRGIGNKHYFFMLKGCVNPENPNGFYNEFIKQELIQDNKRVFEALGNKLAVVDAEDQLSGLGFSSTKRNDLLLKVKTGSTEKIIRIKF